MIRDPETLNLLLDSIRQFVRESLVPHEQEVAETDRIPEAIIACMREMGLFGLSIPEAYGGLGVTMEDVYKRQACWRSASWACSSARSCWQWPTTCSATGSPARRGRRPPKGAARMPE